VSGPNGAGGVDVRLNYRCSPSLATSTEGLLAVNVTQRSSIGELITFGGSGNLPAICDGKGHMTTVFVPALVGTFRPSPANLVLAVASVQNADKSAAAVQNTSIRIRG
jgi:hypothetical protein